MLPEKFRLRITNQKNIDADSLLKALEEPSAVSIRINSSKWIGKPANAEPVPWCSTGFYLDDRPSFTLDPLFHSGCYYPQEASGMFIEQIFKQIVGKQKYLKVLDLCGAPGGKSTHLSSLIGSENLLVSNEVIRPRTSVLTENITKWGVSNTIVTRNDPSAFSGLPGFFDVVLVDAPCSGEGMFSDAVAVNEWSEENTLYCADRQKRILHDVWPSLKQNGILIYSTCTFNPGENEKNIKWLTEKHNAEIIEFNVTDFKGITKIDYQGIKGYGFYPGRIRGEGFFISVIRKKEDSGILRSGISRKTEEKPQKDDLRMIKEWTTFLPGNVIKYGREVISVPGKTDDYLILQQKLKIIKGGTKICSIKKSGYIPAHDLALSNNIRKGAFPVAELDYNHAIAYLRRDNLQIKAVPKGWFLAKYKGVNLGFCNNIGSRINNYFPVEWRIRMSLQKPGTGKIINWNQ